jgi:branched-chain amino acid transport system substrate-binding protein
MTRTYRTGLSRRHILQGGAALAAGAMAMPAVLRAQGAAIKVGILQPVTGALAFDGAQGQIGAMAALKTINDKGGIGGCRPRH